MNEPLFWNPLPEAAKWLSEKINRPMTARDLIDFVAHDQGNPTPTIIKAALPSNFRYATIHKGDPILSGKTKDESLNKVLTNLFGELPSQYFYISWNFIPDLKAVSACPLPDYELLQLLVHGHIGISRLYDSNLDPYEQVWLMPYGSEYEATIDTCGINREDLITLGDRLVKEYAPELIQSDLSKPKPNIKNNWHEAARKIADEVDIKNSRLNTNPSLSDIGDDVSKIMKEKGISNVSGSTVKREALQGDRWTRPRNIKDSGGAGGLGENENTK